MILRCCLLLLVFFSPAVAQPAQHSQTESDIESHTQSQLRVVSSIRPLHSLLSAIMHGSGKPALLLDSSQSIHHYSLRPSERRLLANADLLFWIGDALESFMPRILHALPDHTRGVKLIETDQLLLLPPRQTDSNASGSNNHHTHATVDPHIWLSPANAILMAKKMAAVLSEAEPSHAAVYQQNTIKLTARLNQLQKKIRLSFPQKKFNYLVYHDAFQYFEDSIKVKPLAVISTNEEQTPGARHLKRIHKLLTDNKVNCIIYNTSTLPPIVNNLIQDHASLAVYLEPTGQQFKSGEDLYFQLMHTMIDAYKQCQINNSPRP